MIGDTAIFCLFAAGFFMAAGYHIGYVMGGNGGETR